MPKITKVVIDTNIFIKSLERELEKLSTKGGLDVCKFMLATLRSMLKHLYKALDKSQFICLASKQIVEIKRWFHTNVCRDADTRDIDELFEITFARRRRWGMSLDKGIRPLKRSEVSAEKQRLGRYGRGRQVQKQIESLCDDVDRLILYFSLGRCLKGENIKVITADSELADKFYVKVNELGIRDNIEVKYVPPERVSLHILNDLVRDP